MRHLLAVLGHCGQSDILTNCGEQSSRPATLQERSGMSRQTTQGIELVSRSPRSQSDQASVECV